VRSLIQDIEAKFEVDCEPRICDGERGETLMLHARHAALTVLGAGRQPERQVSMLTLSEDVIFASGRPSILLPSAWPADKLPQKIVVGWNASREAARALSDAMPLLRDASEVHVVVVEEPKIARLLGQEPGADISRHLARYGVPVILHRLAGDEAGRLLLSHAKAIGADLIVMGAYGQTKITEFVFGSATQTLLSNPEIPVLLSR
jgi:nucleotide-binding universal stress UspA family protein